MSNTMKDALFLLTVGILGAFLFTCVSSSQAQPQRRSFNLSRHRLWYRSV